MNSLRCAYIVILAGICAALHVAKVSPALPALSLEFSLSATQAGFLLSLVQLAGMFLGLLIGALVEIFGRRNSIIAGLTLMAACSFLGLLSPNATLLLALRGLEGLGFLLVVMPAPAMLRQLVAPKELSNMIGVWGAYMPIGTALSLLVGTLVIVWLNWYLWWLLLALTTLVVIVAVIKNVPPDSKRELSQSDGTPRLHVRDTLKQLSAHLRLTLRSLGPWLVALGFCMYSAQWLTIIGFLPSIYTQAGITGVLAGMMTALVAVANIVGNVYAGRFISRNFFAPHLLYFGFMVMGVCAFIAFGTLNWSAPWLIWPRFIAILLFSAAGGLIPSTLFYLAMHLAPSQQTISTTVGWAQQLSSTGQFIVPPLVGALADAHNGDWQWTWVVLCLCSFMGFMVAKAAARLMKRPAAT